MFSVSIEFVNTFHSVFKVLHGEIKQMLSWITFACWEADKHFQSVTCGCEQVEGSCTWGAEMVVL